jgi:hypothetical protein
LRQTAQPRHDCSSSPGGSSAYPTIRPKSIFLCRGLWVPSLIPTKIRIPPKALALVGGSRPNRETSFRSRANENSSARSSLTASAGPVVNGDTRQDDWCPAGAMVGSDRAPLSKWLRAGGELMVLIPQAAPPRRATAAPKTPKEGAFPKNWLARNAGLQVTMVTSS